MNIVKLTKIIGLSTVTSQVCLFADTYKPEVAKDIGEGKVRFRVENLTDAYAGANSFSVLDNRDGDIVDGHINNVITNLSSEAALLKFGFGTFRVCYDRQTKAVQLHNGSFLDSLVMEKSDFPIIVGRNKYLLANTLLMKDISFKNEGTFRGSITLFQNCKSVENKEDFWVRNLFLSGSCFINQGIVTRNDILEETNGGKLYASYNSETNRLGILKEGFGTNTVRDLTNAPKTGERRMGWIEWFFGGFLRNKVRVVNPGCGLGAHTVVSIGSEHGEVRAGYLDKNTGAWSDAAGVVLLANREVSVVRYEFLCNGNELSFEERNGALHYLIFDNPYDVMRTAHLSLDQDGNIQAPANNAINQNQNAQNNNANANVPNNQNNQNNQNNNA